MQKGMTNETGGDRVAGSDADMESDSRNAPVGANEAQAFASPVRVTIHHTRKRLADLDGLSGKAVLDGIVAAGILADDSPEQIAEIRVRQAKGKSEKTVIVIEELASMEESNVAGTGCR